MEVRKGYKQTEAGVIPEDWEVKPIKNLNFDISDGNYSSRYPKASDFRAFGVPFIRANNIKGLKVVDDDLRYISEVQHAELLSGHLKKNDILITTRGDIGQIAFVPDRHIDSNINAQLVRINVGKTGHSHRFVGYILTFGNVQKQFESLQTGSALKQLPVGKLITLNLPLPPTLAEQEAIAEALSDADALIESLKTLLAKKRQVKQGAIQELITGKRRLPGFENNTGYKQTEAGAIPKDWQAMALAKVCKMKSGESITGNNIDQFSEYPCYGGNGLRGYTDRFTHDGKYALIGRQGALCGNVLGVSGKFFASEHAVVVTPFEQTDINWLTYVLEDMHLNQYSESSAQPGLSVSKILNLVLAIPSTKVEQTAIAEILSDMDTEIHAVEEKLSKARRVKAGMMSALLGGKIRLV